jgi:hypothetical protein
MRTWHANGQPANCLLKPDRTADASPHQVAESIKKRSETTHMEQLLLCYAGIEQERLIPSENWNLHRRRFGIGGMMDTLQPGRKALITNHRYPQNIGCYVSLILYVKDQEIIDVPTIGEVKNMTGYSGWLVSGHVKTGRFEPEQDQFGSQSGFCICKTEHLMPVYDTDPDGVASDIKTLIEK